VVFRVVFLCGVVGEEAVGVVAVVGEGVVEEVVVEVVEEVVEEVVRKRIQGSDVVLFVGAMAMEPL
jgi:hypothetical protein